MKVENFCKIFIFSLLNLACFLLSVIFLTSTYNLQDQSYFIKCEYKTFNKQYDGIATLFSFSLIAFVVFTVALVIIIKKDKMESENNSPKYETRDINQEQIDNNNINSGERIKVYNYEENGQNIEEEMEDVTSTNQVIMNTLIISFVCCQIFYFIELIIISAFYTKSLSFDYKSCKDKDELTKINKNLLVVGYIFLFIYILFYIYLLILFNKCGPSAKKRLAKLTNSKYCECCNDCIVKGCLKCIECFYSKTDIQLEDENRINQKRLEEDNNTKLKYIESLEAYKKDLENLNRRNSSGIVDEKELARLNLYKFTEN